MELLLVVSDMFSLDCDYANQHFSIEAVFAQNNISRTNNNSLNFKKSQDKKNNNIKYNLKYNSRKKIGQDDDKNNKKIYNDSKD